MKKTLLPCFLALLCLFGSELKSQVAWTPEAGFPPPSDLPRGGGSRPEIFSPNIFGLVDSDQGRSAGERALSSDPAPVPVLTSQKEQNSENQESDPESPNSWAVCFDSSQNHPIAPNRAKEAAFPVAANHPGREEYSTPAQRGDSLSVGDQFPPQLGFSEVLNYDSDELYVSDFLGKYVILQFWATWCSASSGSLPKAQQLQEKYREQFQFIPVTYESAEKVEKKLDFYSSLRSLDLPMIVSERRLSGLFPHISLPHLVILDPKGKVVAITGWQDMNEANLDELIATGSADFRLKADTSIPFSFEQNLISGNTHLPSKNIRYQSALTGYLPGVPGGLMDDREDGAHIVLVNNPLLKFYRLAYTGRDLANYFGPNRMELEGFEEDEITTRKSGLDYIEWMEEGNRVFSYELIAPPGVDQYQLMREDLRRYFPEIRAEIKTRKKKVWAIVLPEGKSYPRSTAESSYAFNPHEAKLRNYPLLGLVYQLNIYSLQRSPYPLIDLTGIDYPIDLDLKANFSQPEALKKALQEAGLDLELREAEIPVLHLKKLETLTQK